MTNNICQEEKCVTSGAATHYLNQEWIYGCCAVARLDEGETAEISVYPNPAVTQLSVIGYLFSENSAVEIYDVHGKRIFSQQVKVNTRQPLTIDVSAWMQGMYFVTVTAGNNVFTEKILVK